MLQPLKTVLFVVAALLLQPVIMVGLLFLLKPIKIAASCPHGEASVVAGSTCQHRGVSVDFLYFCLLLLFGSSKTMWTRTYPLLLDLSVSVLAVLSSVVPEAPQNCGVSIVDAAAFCPHGAASDAAGKDSQHHGVFVVAAMASFSHSEGFVDVDFACQHHAVFVVAAMASCSHSEAFVAVGLERRHSGVSAHF